MPARSARSPRAFPFHRPVRFIPSFPEREIADVLLLVLVALYPAGRTQFFQVEMRELAVTGKFVDPIRNRLVLSLVGKTALQQCLDHHDHLPDLLPRDGLVGRIARLGTQLVEYLE